MVVPSVFSELTLKPIMFWLEVSTDQASSPDDGAVPKASFTISHFTMHPSPDGSNAYSMAALVIVSVVVPFLRTTWMPFLLFIGFRIFKSNF